GELDGRVEGPVRVGYRHLAKRLERPAGAWRQLHLDALDRTRVDLGVMGGPDAAPHLEALSALAARLRKEDRQAIRGVCRLATSAEEIETGVEVRRAARGGVRQQVLGDRSDSRVAPRDVLRPVEVGSGQRERRSRLEGRIGEVAVLSDVKEEAFVRAVDGGDRVERVLEAEQRREVDEVGIVG